MKINKLLESKSVREGISSTEPVVKFQGKSSHTFTKDKKWEVDFDEKGNIVARTRHGKPSYFKGHIDDKVNDFPSTDEDNIILAAREQHGLKFGKKNEAFEKDGGPFWYFTKHGLGPGMLPKGVNVVDTIEDDNFGTYIALDKVLTTQELKDYELKEKKPDVKEGMSHFEFTSGDNPYIAKTKDEAERIKRSRGDSAKFVGSINGIDYYKVDDGEETDLFSVDEAFKPTDSGIQSVKVYNPYNYTIQELRVDNDNKTFERGNFTAGKADKKTKNRQEYEDIVDSLKELGYTEIKSDYRSMRNKSRKGAPTNESFTNKTDLVDKLDNLRYVSMAVDEGEYITIKGGWRTTSRQSHSDYVNINSFLGKELGEGNYALVYERDDHRDNGSERSCILRLELKNNFKESWTDEHQDIMARKTSGYAKCYEIVKKARTSKPVDTKALDDARDHFGDDLYKMCLDDVLKEMNESKSIKESIDSTFKVGDTFDYSGLYGGSQHCEVINVTDNAIECKVNWTSEDDGKDVSDTATFKLDTDSEGNQCAIVWEYNGEVGRVYPHSQLSESIDVNDIAHYIIDNYEFDNINDQSECIDELRDSFKFYHNVSVDEIKNCVRIYKGKEKVKESFRPYDNEKGQVMADKWYASQYPDDEIGIEQLKGITLDDALKDRSILDHCDTQVRERVYAQLDKYIPLSKESPMYKEVNEASYGGAFDIADDQYFTREDLENAAEEVLNHINETFEEPYNLGGTWFEDGKWIVNVQDDGFNEYEVSVPVDMRKIREPWHLRRAYADDVAAKLIAQIKEYNGLDEDTTVSSTFEFDDDVDDLTYYYDDEEFRRELEEEPYNEIASKQVPDVDGFLTDYTMYQNMNTGEYVFVFGDKDVYRPEDGNFDWECETEEEAREWFDNYIGFDDDLIDECWSSKLEEETETSPIVHKKTDGSYLVQSDSGDGYTAFNKDNVCQGHISASNETEAKNKFNSNKFDE